MTTTNISRIKVTQRMAAIISIQELIQDRQVAKSIAFKEDIDKITKDIAELREMINILRDM